MAAVRVFGPPALPSPAPLTDQAAAWAEHVLATSDLSPVYVTRKALDAVAFSLRHGLRDLSVPSKLVGVAAHQLAVEALARGACPERSRRADLPVHDRPRLVVSHTLDVGVYPERSRGTSRSDRTLRPLGRIQPKHAAWLAPLRGSQRP